MLNQSIKFFTIFLLVFSGFAGGDDRDEEYYETLDEELAAFEAQLAEDLVNQAALEAFQQKLADEKAAAAASTAAYQSKLAYDAEGEERMEALAIEQELDAFEAQLEADLAAQEMMAEIIAEDERAKRLAEFQAKLDFEAKLAAKMTAAYQAKVAEEKAAAAELAAFKAELAAHEECKAASNLTDSNIALFKTALAAGNLFSVGPQITAGTEFTANRWDDYASCIGALGYKNPF